MELHPRAARDGARGTRAVRPQGLGLAAGPVVLEDARVADRRALKVRAEVQVVTPVAKGRAEGPVADYPARVGVDAHAAVAAAVGQVCQVHQDQGAVGEGRAGGVGRGPWEGDAVQGGVVCHGHLGVDGRVQREGKVAWAGLHRVIDTFGCSQCLGKLALVYVVVRASCLGEYWKVAFPLPLNDATRLVSRGSSIFSKHEVSP